MINKMDGNSRTGENESDLVDIISGEPLDEELKTLSIRLELEDASSFIFGYCASDEKTYHAVSQRIQKLFSIPPESVLNHEYQHKEFNLNLYLNQNKELISSLPSEIVLINVSGFERDAGFGDDMSYSTQIRRAHDYGQDVKEPVKLGESPLCDLDKKVIVLTHIDPLYGREKYERALKSALSSQFKDFVYEIK